MVSASKTKLQHTVATSQLGSVIYQYDTMLLFAVTLKLWFYAQCTSQGLFLASMYSGSLAGLPVQVGRLEAQLNFWKPLWPPLVNRCAHLSELGVSGTG